VLLSEGYVSHLRGGGGGLGLIVWTSGCADLENIYIIKLDEIIIARGRCVVLLVKMDEVQVRWSGKDLLVFESKGRLYASIDALVNTLLVEYVTCRALYTRDGLEGYERVVTAGIIIQHVWTYLFVWRRLTDLQTDYLASLGLDFGKGTSMVLKMYLAEMQRADFVFGADMFPYRVIRHQPLASPPNVVGSAGKRHGGYRCDPGFVQLLALSAFMHVFDIARFRQAIGIRAVYDEVLGETLTFAVCRIRQLYIRSRFEYVSMTRTREGKVDHVTPPDIKVRVLWIPKRIFR